MTVPLFNFEAHRAESDGYGSPAMIRWVAFFDCDENSVASGTNFSPRAQCSFNGRPIIC